MIRKMRCVIALRYLSGAPSVLLLIGLILREQEITRLAVRVIFAWMMVSLLIIYFLRLMPSRELIVQLAIQSVFPMLVVLIVGILRA